MIISALKRLPQSPCLPGSTWGQPTADGLLLPAERQRLPTAASAPLARSFFPFPALSLGALQALAHSVDSSAHRQSSASRFHRKLCKIRNIVQNYNENVDAALTVHRKTFIPQKLSMEPVKTKTSTLGYATSVTFPFHVFFVLYKGFCFVLSLIQNPQKLMKTFPIPFQRLWTRPPMRMNTCFSYCIYSH